MFARLSALWQRLNRPLLSVAAAVLIGLVYYLGVASERTGFVQEVIDPGFRKLSDPVLNAFRAKPPPVEQIVFVLDSVAWDSLKAMSTEAFHQGRLEGMGNPVFAATARYRDVEVPIVIGLLEGEAPLEETRMWPLHVRALPGDTILGMQTFDILPVVDATPIWSLLMNQVLAGSGHATLGQALAEVDLNGSELGLCVCQGRIDATMLANCPIGSGPVLRFDGELLRASRSAMTQRIFPSTAPTQGDWASAPLLMRTVEESTPNKRARKAIDRMEAFRNGRALASEVFDVRQVARLMAVCDILGAQSGMDWWELQFLVDSVTGALIPVAPHLHVHEPITAILGTMASSDELMELPGREMAAHFLKDEMINGYYLAYLDTFSRAGWWQGTLVRTAPKWNPVRNIIHAEFPRMDLDTTILAHDRTVIHQTLFPKDLVLAYMQNETMGTKGVAVANVHNLPVEVYGLVYSEGDTTILESKVQLAAHARDHPLVYVMLPMNVKEHAAPPKAVLARISPYLIGRSIPIRVWTTLGAN